MTTRRGGQEHRAGAHQPLRVAAALLALGAAAACRQGTAVEMHELQVWVVDDEGERALEDQSLVVGESLALKAMKVSVEGEGRDAVDATWRLLCSLPTLDLLWASPASAEAVFTPTQRGSCQIEAVAFKDAIDLVSRQARSGVVEVVLSGAVAQLQLWGGNGQAGVVNSSLAEPLQVLAQDANGLPVLGASILYEQLMGDGELLSANPALTDAEGVARMELLLGVRAGEDNHLVRASSEDRPELYVDFVASAAPGPPAALAFEVQPASAYVNTPFRVQPVVGLHDAFGNRSASTEDVALTVAVGTGALVGTTTVAMEAGVARFAGVGYSVAEAGVVLRAASGAVSGESDPIGVVAFPPGGCQVDDALFMTGDGGCQDLQSGLVWSARAPDVMTWDDAVWDAQRAGSAAPDASDLGWTNDYPRESDSCPGNCDSAAESYCHSLNEGGMTDWRLPSLEELATVVDHSMSGTPPYLQPGDGLAWSGNSRWASSDYRYAYLVDVASGTESHTEKWNTRNVYCVRGDRAVSDHIVVASGPERVLAGVRSREVPLVVALVDASGRQVNRQGLEVRITSSSTGEASGEVGGETDASGRASLLGWTLDTPGSASLTIEADGVAPATFPVEVLAEGLFAEAAGGCQDLFTGLVWSERSADTMSWYAAVWDAARADSPSPDSDDLGRSNDYPETSSPCPGNCDGDAEAYCHNLLDGGVSDWRLPTEGQLVGLNSSISAAGASCIAQVSGSLWASSTQGDDSRRARFVDLQLGTTGSGWKSDGHHTRCVRGDRPAPHHLAIVSGPGSVGLGFAPAGPLQVAVRGPEGEQINAQGLTATIASTSLGLLSGPSSAQTDMRGVASLGGWQLDTAGVATLSVELAGYDAVSYEVQVVDAGYPHVCAREGERFVSAEGGCKDTHTLLVWSSASPATMSWHEAVWDAANPEGNVSPDADDGGRTHDYDNVPAAKVDASVANYCHELVEGGFGDWRLPRRDELVSAADFGEGAAVHFSIDGDQEFHSSTSTGTYNSYRVNLRSGGLAERNKDDTVARTICVRSGT